MPLSTNLYHLIIKFLKPYKYGAMVFAFMAICAGFWGPFNSRLAKWLIDALPAAQHDATLLYAPAALIILNFLVFDNVTWRTMNLLTWNYMPQIKNDITRTLFLYTLSHSHQYFQDNLSGRISSQINTLAENICNIFWPNIPNFLRGGSLLIAGLISALCVNPIFCLIIIVWLLFFVSFSLYMSRKIVGLADAVADADTKVSGEIVDAISNASNVRLFGRKMLEALYLDKFLAVRKAAFQKEELYITFLCTVQGLLIATMLGFTVYFLVELYAKQVVTAGDFAMILWIVIEIGHMIWWTMYQVDEFNKAVGKCRQCIKHLIVPHSVVDHEDASLLTISDGSITFDKVKFHYKGVRPLFEDKSITIHGGQKVGLVGYSGGGKTTFVNLILRLYDVTDGTIMIDGQNIAHVTQETLRHSIAMIPQDPTLFHRSIMDNIRYGKPDATDDEVIEAAKKAHAHEFIELLPLGYDSLVGERGVRLSGGQRQRIAIARAILKNAPILILDEATSQLDSITEQKIQESLWLLMQNKTTIVIAHRLSTLLHMDRILVFEKGHIVQDGSHEQLIAQDGLYKTLWSSQVGGFLVDKKSA